MKLPKLLLSAFISLSLIIPAAAVPDSHAASARNAEVLILRENTEAASLESYASQLRRLMRDHNTSFTLAVPSTLIKSSQDIDNMIGLALKETGSPKEGDYLRWCISGYSYSVTADHSTGDYIFNFSVSYYTTAEQEKAVDSAVSSIMSSLDVGTGTDYEIIAAVYAWVVTNVTYSDTENNSLKYTAYGAVVQHTAVCQGYAVLMYRLLSEYGIPCRVIPGTGNSGKHAWNIAAIDGKYYYLDSAWDSSAGASSFYYLLRGTSDFDALSKRNIHSRTWEHRSSMLYADYDNGTFDERYPVQEKAYVFKPDTVSYKLGDVNNDRFVDSKDASFVLAAYSKLSTIGKCGFSKSRTAAADINNDGFIDSKDASWILSYYSFLSTGGNDTIDDYLKNQKVRS